MMDNECIVSNSQSAIQAAVGALLSDFSYDTGVAGTPPAAVQAIGSIFHDLGRGGALQAFAEVNTTITGAGLTMQCALVMADNAVLSTNLTVLSETPAIAVATLVAGYQFAIGAIPQGISRRFLGFRYTTAVAVATAGTLFAGFLVGRQTVRVASPSL